MCRRSPSRFMIVRNSVQPLLHRASCVDPSSQKARPSSPSRSIAASALRTCVDDGSASKRGTKSVRNKRRSFRDIPQPPYRLHSSLTRNLRGFFTVLFRPIPVAFSTLNPPGPSRRRRARATRLRNRSTESTRHARVPTPVRTTCPSRSKRPRSACSCWADSACIGSTTARARTTPVSARAGASKLDISRPTIAKWPRRFLADGIEELTSRYRGLAHREVDGAGPRPGAGRY